MMILLRPRCFSGSADQASGGGSVGGGIRPIRFGGRREREEDSPRKKTQRELKPPSVEPKPKTEPKIVKQIQLVSEEDPREALAPSIIRRQGIIDLHDLDDQLAALQLSEELKANELAEQRQQKLEAEEEEYMLLLLMSDF